MALFGGSSFGSSTTFGANAVSGNFGTTPNPMKVDSGQFFKPVFAPSGKVLAYRKSSHLGNVGLSQGDQIGRFFAN
jgi:hypothetical protein